MHGFSKHILALITFLFLFSCKNNDQASFEMADEVAMSPIAGKQTENIERKLIKEGNISFETSDINNTRKSIFESIEKFKGYVASDQEYKSNGRVSNTIIIRVPANNFDQLLNDATKEVTKFDSKNIEIKDVTEEFVDVEARLKTKKELEKRYSEILTKANSVTEMLEVEKQIGELRSDIEAIEGRLNYLKSQVSFSTLTITFYEIQANETQFGHKFKNGFSNGWDNLVWFFVALLNIWPFIIIISILVIWLLWRKKKSKQNKV